MIPLYKQALLSQGGMLVRIVGSSPWLVGLFILSSPCATLHYLVFVFVIKTKSLYYKVTISILTCINREVWE